VWPGLIHIARQLYTQEALGLNYAPTKEHIRASSGCPIVGYPRAAWRTVDLAAPKKVGGCDDTCVPRGITWISGSSAKMLSLTKERLRSNRKHTPDALWGLCLLSGVLVS